jgi:hypothetical protein
MTSKWRSAVVGDFVGGGLKVQKGARRMFFRKRPKREEESGKIGDEQRADQHPPEAEELISHSGMLYIDKIADTANAANTYFEIGTYNGASLAPIHCASIAVDPEFRLTENVMVGKRVCHLYQETSDDFFASYDPKSILGNPIDTAFLDGMHLYEFLLRDFINIEKHCRPDSTIFLHDCLPPTFEMTNRDGKAATLNYKDYWTGDVWKVIPILQKYRPDLKLTFFDCPPTGLVAITNLDPGSSILSARYEQAVSEAAEGPRDMSTLRLFLSSVVMSYTSQSDNVIAHGLGET